MDFWQSYHIFLFLYHTVICLFFCLRMISRFYHLKFYVTDTFGQNCSVVITVNPEDEIYVLYEGGSLSSACDTFQFKHNSTLCITSLNHDDPDCAVELQYYIKNDSRTPEKVLIVNRLIYNGRFKSCITFDCSILKKNIS